MRLKNLSRLSLFLFVISTIEIVDARRKNPDFLKGESIPKAATHDWNLGATGARGWMFSMQLETALARQIYITKVDRGSPAAGVLEVGDVILGVGGRLFTYDPRVEMGKALTIAESNEGKGDLSLIRWRNGQQINVVVKLKVLGDYSATAPYECVKSERIVKEGCDAIIESMKNSNYSRQFPTTRSLNALALLASGESKYLPDIKKEAEWAAALSPRHRNLACWHYGYPMMFLAEYHMVTGDRSVLPGLRRLAIEISGGQSRMGTWGHDFAVDDRLIGYGAMNIIGVPVTIGLVLAREAGVKAPEIDLAIERSLNFLRFYKGKGAIPYGDNSPALAHDSNGKNGMAAVLFGLVGEKEVAEYFSRMSLASHGAERDGGHSANFWNIAWAMPGVMHSGPNATGAWMKEFGAWYYDLARRGDGRFIHQGPPDLKPDRTKNWDLTGACVLAHAMPLKKIMLTGRKSSNVPHLSVEEAQSIIIDGRGWGRLRKKQLYNRLSVPHLFERLTNWSPVVRERAAKALARPRGDYSPVPHLIKMLDFPSPITREGACRALRHLGPESKAAIPALRKNLKHEDLWLRVQAAEAIAAIGPTAMPVVPELLMMLAEGPSKHDPGAMQQRYISLALFNAKTGMLRNSIQGVDRDVLYKAVRAGLKSDDGGVRAAYATVYDKLSYEEIKPLLPAIYDAVKIPSASGIRYTDRARVAGLKILAKYRVREGIPLCIDVMGFNKWRFGARLEICLGIIQDYGVAAKPLLPELEQMGKKMQRLMKLQEKQLKRFNRFEDAKARLVLLQKAIANLKTTTKDVQLRSIN